MENLAGYALEANIGGVDALEANIGGVSMLRGSDGKSAYAYAVEGGYTGTETEFAEKLAQDIPTTLPNPNALTFTGAVTGSYDGSAPLSVEIPSGGLSGSDISLGLTGAAVGQIAKITAVDGTGKPTAWGQADMPDKLPNPNALTFTGAVTGSYDGSTSMAVNIPSAVTDGHINSLIDAQLGVIENGDY